MVNDDKLRFENVTHRLQNQRNIQNQVSIFDMTDKINELGSIDNTYNNIDDMDKQLNTLLENGSINEEQWEYSHLKDTIKQQTEIARKPDKSIKEIVNFYSSVKDFNNITSRLNKEGLK